MRLSLPKTAFIDQAQWSMHMGQAVWTFKTFEKRSKPVVFSLFSVYFMTLLLPLYFIISLLFLLNRSFFIMMHSLLVPITLHRSEPDSVGKTHHNDLSLVVH